MKREDSSCGKCGADLKQQSIGPPMSTTMLPVPPEMPPPAPPLPPYQAKYGAVSRLFRILLKPSETMKDIALAPDYGGVMIILVLEAALTVVSIAFIFSRFDIAGTYAVAVRSILLGLLVVTSAISVIGLPIKWLIKSWIVQKVCGARSGWSFKSAASVTGYAYVASLVVSLVTMPFLPFVVPTIRYDTSSLDALRQAVETYTAQMATMKLYFTLPTIIVALIWKSYLGGAGTHHGTRQLCRILDAFFLFFLLGLVSVALTFIV